MGWPRRTRPQRPVYLEVLSFFQSLRLLKNKHQAVSQGARRAHIINMSISNAAQRRITA
jgi:hypothetical protein